MPTTSQVKVYIVRADGSDFLLCLCVDMIEARAAALQAMSACERIGAEVYPIYVTE